MTIAVRVDSSREIGTGHLMRCLTLADALRALGERVVFIMRPLPGALLDVPRALGFDVIALPAPDGCVDTNGPAHATWLATTRDRDAQETRDALAKAQIDAEWLLVDSYALDARWEQAVIGSAGRVAVIDDLADRPHECAALVDVGCDESGAARYQSLVPSGCRLMLGPRFALLRREFASARRAVDVRRSVRRVLVFFGGVDETDNAAAALEALAPLAATRALALDVVWGDGYAHAEALKQRYAGSTGVELIGPTNRIADLMAAADLAVGAAGSTSWERAFLGLGAVALSVAHNQAALCRRLAAAGAAVCLGDAAAVQAREYVEAVEAIAADTAAVGHLSRGAFELMRDAGIARRHPLVDLMLTDRDRPPAFALRTASASDLPMLLRWRNAAVVRSFMNTQLEIRPQQHEAWFRTLSADPSAAAYVFEVAGTPSGFFQLKGIDVRTGRAQWGYYLAPEAMGRGLGRAMCFLGAEVAFDDFDLEEIRGEVLPGNDRSMRLHEDFGFRRRALEDVAVPGSSGYTLSRAAWDERRSSVGGDVFRRRG